MTTFRVWACAMLLLLYGSLTFAQQSKSYETTKNAVPPLVNFNGVLTDTTGKPLSGIVGVTFSFYKDQEGGAPLWMEVQNVSVSKNGHYTVTLGSTSATGLPSDIFVAGEARWLAVHAEGQPEQARVLLLSVPYALKAADAETIGGLPPSAFVRAPEPGSSASAGSTGTSVPATTVTGSGTLDYLPMWTGTSSLGNSPLFAKGANVGIGTNTPATTLDVKGAATIRGNATVTGTFTSSSTLAAAGGGFSGNNTSQILSVKQSGSGAGLFASTASNTGGSAAISGIATATTGKGRGIVGTSSSDAAGIGVIGGAGTLGGSGSSTGVFGYSFSNGGTGVSGVGSIGVAGSSATIAGQFQATTPSGLILKGLSSTGATQFSVDGAGNLFNSGNLAAWSISASNGLSAAGMLSSWGNQQAALIGDPGCGPGYAGIGFGTLSGCSNYSMIGNGVDTFVNRPVGGYIHFRENNGGSQGASDQVVIAPGGAVGIGTSFPNAQLDIRGGGGNSGFGIATDTHAWQAANAGGFVKAMAFIDPFTPGGISVVNCFNSQGTLASSATTAPCGITIKHIAQGNNILDFGFQVSDRFIQLTPYLSSAAYNVNQILSYGAVVMQLNSTTASQADIYTFDTSNNGANAVDVPFYVVIY